MKFLFSALLVPGLCLGAIWPDSIGAWKRGATLQTSLVRPPALGRVWTQGIRSRPLRERQENFTVTGYRLQDTTGAMAAFDWQRSAKATASKLAPLAAETPDGLLVVHGNYLLAFDGYKPEAAELTALYGTLSNIDTTVLPTLPGNLPDPERIPNSERYIIGPAGLAKFAPAIPPSVAAFHYGAEAQIGPIPQPRKAT